MLEQILLSDPQCLAKWMLSLQTNIKEDFYVSVYIAQNNKNGSFAEPLKQNKKYMRTLLVSNRPAEGYR